MHLIPEPTAPGTPTKEATDRITGYIKRTKSAAVRSRCCMKHSDLSALIAHAKIDLYGAITLAFDFGCAKGYRAASTETKRKEAQET